jgi:hypothetical protein
MRALSIFIVLTYFADEIYKQTNIHRFDGPMRGNREASCRGVPENDVACPMLIVIDAQAARHYLQILDPPIAWIPPHFGDKFRRV